MSVQEEKCSFIPLKKGAEACAIPPTVSFGAKRYCKSHSKTRQALQEKAKFESEEKERIKKEQEEKLKIEEQKRVEEEKRLEEKRLEEEKARLEKEQEPLPEPKVLEVSKLPKFPFQKEVVEIGDHIELNSWGRYEDPKSNYVFHRNKCYGRQLPNGEVAALSPKDILFLDKNEIPHVEEDSDYETEEDADSVGEEEEAEDSEGEEEEDSEEEAEETDEEEEEEEEDDEEEEDL